MEFHVLIRRKRNLFEERFRNFKMLFSLKSIVIAAA